MNRQDMIAAEKAQAANYRREARRRTKNPTLAARLVEWADASERRCDEIRFGPLFGERE